MEKPRCTLRHIAEKCHVSKAVVSTVISGNRGNISCSDDTRQRILAVARELNYTPNVLARSIRQKQIPLVGVFLRQDPETGTLSRSTTKTLSAAARALNKHHFETIFVPFTDSQSQYERMRSLISKGLLGGIITCICNEEADAVCGLLKSAGLPYLILGNPPVRDVYCLYYRDSVTAGKCLALAASRGLKYCFSAAPSFPEGDLLFRQMPYPDYFIWNAPAVPAEKVRALESEALLVIMGTKLRGQLLSLGFNCKNCVIVEFMEDKNKVPETFDAAFVRQTSVKAEHIEELFCPWLLENKKMNTFHNVLELEEDNFEFRFRQP